MLNNDEILEETSSYSSDSPKHSDPVSFEKVRKRMAKKLQSNMNLKDQPFVLSLMRQSLEKKMSSLKRRKSGVKSSLNISRLLNEIKPSPSREDESDNTTDQIGEDMEKVEFKFSKSVSKEEKKSCIG